MNVLIESMQASDIWSAGKSRLISRQLLNDGRQKRVFPHLEFYLALQ